MPDTTPLATDTTMQNGDAIPASAQGVMLAKAGVHGAAHLYAVVHNQQQQVLKGCTLQITFRDANTIFQETQPVSDMAPNEKSVVLFLTSNIVPYSAEFRGIFKLRPTGEVSNPANTTYFLRNDSETPELCEDDCPDLFERDSPKECRQVL